MTTRAETIMRNAALYKALLEAKIQLPVITKNKTASIQTTNGRAYNYSYADLADIDIQITPVLADHGLLMDFEMHKNDNGVQILTGMLIHPTSEGFKTSEWEVTGRTPQEQGASITYGRRYLTGILTGTITDEDTDGRPTSSRPAAGPKRAPKPTNPATPEQIQELGQANQSGLDLATIMRQTIGRVARPEDITQEEAEKVLQAANNTQS